MSGQDIPESPVVEQFDAWVGTETGNALLAIAGDLGVARKHARQLLRIAFIAGSTHGILAVEAAFVSAAVTARARAK